MVRLSLSTALLAAKGFMNRLWVSFYQDQVALDFISLFINMFRNKGGSLRGCKKTSVYRNVFYQILNIVHLPRTVKGIKARLR